MSGNDNRLLFWTRNKPKQQLQRLSILAAGQPSDRIMG